MPIKVVFNPTPRTLSTVLKPTPRPLSTAGTVFIGSSDALVAANSAGEYANAAFIQANSAFIEANSAYDSANTKLPLAGGEITGNLTVDGTFTSLIDGGLF